MFCTVEIVVVCYHKGLQLNCAKGYDNTAKNRDKRPRLFLLTNTIQNIHTYFALFLRASLTSCKNSSSEELWSNEWNASGKVIGSYGMDGRQLMDLPGESGLEGMLSGVIEMRAPFLERPGLAGMTDCSDLI